MEIKLLAAPVLLPPIPEANGDSTSLVPFSRLHSAGQIIPASDSAYPADSYVWSVLAGDNGSYHFYAVPLRNYLGASASSQEDGLLSPYAPKPGWSMSSASQAIAGYQLCASMSPPAYGHMLNVYA
jgi:hypothetical protein